MANIFKKLGFSSECIECKKEDSLRKCPHCSSIVCSSCLNRLVQRDAWPEAMKGRKVGSLQELKNILNSYCDALKTKGIPVHLCSDFISYRWVDMGSLIAQEEAKGNKIKVVLK